MRANSESCLVMGRPSIAGFSAAAQAWTYPALELGQPPVFRCRSSIWRGRPAAWLRNAFRLVPAPADLDHLSAGGRFVRDRGRANVER